MNQLINKGGLTADVLIDTIKSSPIGTSIWRVTNPNNIDTNSIIFLFGNDAYDKTVGINSQNIVGKSLVDAFPNVVNTIAPKLFIDAMRTGNSQYSPDIEYSDKNVNKGIFRITISPIGSEYICLMVQNVTQERAMQEEIKKKILELDNLHAHIVSQEAYSKRS